MAVIGGGAERGSRVTGRPGRNIRFFFFFFPFSSLLSSHWDVFCVLCSDSDKVSRLCSEQVVVSNHS